MTGKVIEVDERQAIVELDEGVNGLIKAFDVAKERTDDVSAVLSVGDEVEAKFVSMDRRKKMLVLSIKAKESDELNDVLNEYKKGSSGTTSLGDLLKEQLDD